MKCPTDQAGGVLFGFLFLMTIALLALSLYSIRWAQLWDSQKLRAICRAELTSAFNDVGDQVQELLEMNQKIEVLRGTEKSARIALAAASAVGLAPAVAAAKLTLRMVETTQRILRLRQLYLFSKGHLRLLRARQNITARLRAQPRHLGLVQRDIRRLWGFPPRLAVRKADQDPKLPKYELKPHFERLQRMELKWQSKFTRAEEGQWSIAHLNSPESCGMTLRNQGSDKKPKFAAMPTQDKYFWRR